MSSQKTETHWQARASEVGLREQLEQANGPAAVAEARADFADQAFAACHAEGEELRERVDELTAKLADAQAELAAAQDQAEAARARCGGRRSRAGVAAGRCDPTSAPPVAAAEGRLARGVSGFSATIDLGGHQAGRQPKPRLGSVTAR
jgi:hypothetical protein